jgi:prefoldin subunit 5
VAATGQGLPTLAERLRRLRDQAEQLARELEALEKEAQKK